MDAETKTISEQQSDSKVGNDLRTINEWIEKRLSGKDHNDVLTLEKDFIREKIHEVKEVFNVKTCRLVSLRSSFRKNQDYLRPVYSFPTNLKTHFASRSFQKPFSFEYEVESNFPFYDLETFPAAKGSPCLLYTSPSPRDLSTSRMPSSA